METLNLNLIPTGANPVAHVSQYDEGRVIRFNLFEGSAVYTLDGTETIECDVKKPDGNVVTLSVPNTSDSYVDVTTTLQTCACAGDNLADIKITKGAVIIATLNFILSVERSPLENGIESDSAIHNLEQQIAEAVADQYDADSVIFDSVPTAGHGIGYAVTSEGVLNSIPEELDDLSDVTITSPSNGEILVFDGAEWVNQANPASTANFAADYDDTATYNTNDKVIYNGLYYIALEDSITGAWDSTKWALTTVSALTAEELPLSGNDSTPTATAIGDLSQLTTSVTSSLVGAVNEVVSTKQGAITYHQETTTPDSGGVFNTGVSLDKVPLSCTSSNGYVSGYVYSGGYWYARIVNYAGQPVTTAVTVSTWYIDNPS